MNQILVNFTRGSDLSGKLQQAGGIGGLLARSDRDERGQKHTYFRSDRAGNVTTLLDSSNRIAARYLYDPYGNLLSAYGPMADSNLYRYSSKEFHMASGLLAYLHRYYDPNLQRWVNRDPSAETGGTDLYTFVGNQPLSVVDPLGLDWHHILPRAVFTPEVCASLGLPNLDIHDQKWGWDIDSAPHQRAHGDGYNKKWQEWVDKQILNGRKFTEKELKCKGRSMLRKFGIHQNGKPATTRYRAKKSLFRKAADAAGRLKPGPRTAGSLALAAFIMSTASANAKATELQEAVYDWEAANAAGDTPGTQEKSIVISTLLGELSNNGLIGNVVAPQIFDPKTPPPPVD